MKFTKLIPNIFYADIKVGLQLFVDCLGFTIVHSDPEGEQPFYVISKDNLAIHLIESAEFAAKDRPELRLEAANIDEAFAEISSKFPGLLHPNLKAVTLRPWNAKEFALRDSSGVCIVIFQWPDKG